MRSGKTWISLVLWALWVAMQPDTGKYLMAGKTLTSLKRNCLDLLAELVGPRNFWYSLAAKEGVLFGRKIYLEGVNDIRADQKIRGMTLTGAYCDEITLFTPEFFAMLLSRLSVSGAKLIGTTNPDKPSHWFKVDYLDRTGELDLMRMQFLIDDNTTLDQSYVAALKREYTGVFYKRFILGEWVVAEGLIYPGFDPVQHIAADAPTDGLWYVSIDYGTMNPFSAGLWCVTPDRAVRMREYYYDGRKEKRQKTDAEYYDALLGLIGDCPVSDIVVDPSAASFIEVIRRAGRYRVTKAHNDVLDGIRHTARLLAAGRVQVCAGCQDIIREFGIYSWDEKSGQDRVIKENDHAMDDMRYFCMTILCGIFRW